MSLGLFCLSRGSIVCLLIWGLSVSVVADVVGKVTGVSRAVTIDVKGHPVSMRTLCPTGRQSLLCCHTKSLHVLSLIFSCLLERMRPWICSENVEANSAIDSEMLIDVSSREPLVAFVM